MLFAVFRDAYTKYIKYITCIKKIIYSSLLLLSQRAEPRLKKKIPLY